MNRKTGLKNKELLKDHNMLSGGGTTVIQI